MPPGFLAGELPSDHGCAHEASETDERAVWYEETEPETDDESSFPSPSSEGQERPELLPKTNRRNRAVRNRASRCRNKPSRQICERRAGHV